MFLFIVCALIVGFLCWLILLELCKCTKIDDTSEEANPELDRVPIKAEVEKHNAQVRQQWDIKQQKAQQHISSILDTAYKDYVSDKIKKNGYIHDGFIILKGEYGITYDEILAINKPFTYSIYNVSCPYSDIFHAYYINVTVNN